MNNEIFDNVIDKAKNLFEATKKKTEETVSTEKMKFSVSSLESKREKEYSKLGKLYFEDLISVNLEDGELKTIVDKIVEINKDIEDLNKKIATIKAKRVCPGCGKFIGEKDTFCPFCGTKVVFDSTEE